jgi:RNA polymerase sigma-70 factor, ECF subfamily
MTMLQADPRKGAEPPQAGTPALPDRDLVARVRTGDAAAFELIMRRHNRRLFRLARSILRNGSEAEDVVQATYVQAYAKLDEFVGPHGFPTWLGRIAMNEALGRLRGWNRVVALEDYVGEREEDATVRRIDTMTTQHPDPERLAGNAELRRLLEDAIDGLPNDFRTVFVLRAVEGMSIAETADALSIRPETVKTRFHRARHRLQATLGARFEALMPTAFEFGGERCDRIVTAVLTRLQPSLAAARRKATRPAAMPPDDQTSRPDSA